MSVLEGQLRELHGQAVERWPGVRVGFEDFRRRVLDATGASANRTAGPAALARCPTDDLYLAVALEAGDAAALDAFYREHHGLIRAVSRKYARNAEDADDVAQDLCATIPRRVAKYAGRGSLKGWVCRIAPNLTRDLYRSGAEVHERSLDARLDADDQTERPGDPSILTDSSKAADAAREGIDRVRCREMFDKALAAALDGLSPEQRELIGYKFFKGLKGREIARIRGVKEYVISKHLKKALTLLRKRLTPAARELSGFSSEEVEDCLELVGT